MRSFIRLNLLLFSLSFFLVFGSSSGIAANLDVCRDGCPYQTIQDAIDAANLGDLIRIAASQDAYNGSLDLNGTKDLTIEGGWDLQTGTSTSNPGSTVIQGDGDTPVIDISTSGNSTLTFRNLTVSGGGNGIEVRPESGSLALRLEQIVVKDNESAGIRVSSGELNSRITVDASNLWITNNRGGIYLLVVMGQEGLVYSQKGRMPMQEEGLVCMANFTNCTITNNNEGIGGVVLGSPYYGETNVTLTNCIVWGNNATTDGDYNEPRPRDIYLPCSYYSYSSDNVSLDHCDIGELVYDGCCTTVSLVDPLWVDPLLLDDFHLSSDSPCIDSGTAVDSPLTDIEGQPRPLGDQFDIGADEVLDCESDQQGPGMVQDLTALFSSGSIILGWQNPPDPDLDVLLLYRLGPGDTEPQMVQQLDKTTETATIDDNITWGDYTFTLVPRDLCGNLGEQAEVEITVTEEDYCESDQQGPGMVQDLTALFSSGSIILGWQNPPDPDLDVLLLYRLGPGDTEPQMVQQLDKTTETATIDDNITWGDYTFTLVPRDLCGNLGEQAEVEITVTGEDYCESDEQGPGMVQDLTARFSSGSIILDWKNPPDPDLDVLLLYRLGPGDTEPQMVQQLDKTTKTATIDDVIPWGHYTLTLVPVDLCGNLGEQAEVEITVTEGPIAYLPFLATTEGWTTEIFIANASERVANVHLNLFGFDGLLSHFEDYTIPPDGILRIPIDQGDAGILQSTESIVALVHISGNAGSAWYPAALFPETELYIPYIGADQHWWTGLALFNPLEFTNHITLHLDNGLDIPLTLPPHGQISLDLCNYIENSGIDCGGDIIRSGRLISTDGAAFVGVSSIAARNWPGADMAIMLLSGDSANVLDVPYIGDNRYSWTGIAVLQTQGMFRSILVQPFSSTGPEAGVEFISSDPEGQSQVALNLSAWIDGTKVRWAEVSLPYLVDEDLRITGSILYSTRGGFDLVNASKLRFRDAVIPVLGDNTSLCLLNPHETHIALAYTTFDEQGNRLVSDTIVMNPRAMEKINLNENFGPSVTHLRILASDTLIGVLQGSKENNENRSPVLSVLGGPEGITQ